MVFKTTKRALTVVVAGAALGVSALAMATPVKIGVLVPQSGTYTVPGTGVLNGLNLALKENGNKLGGRDVEIIVVDSEADPSKAVSNMQKLITGERVDLIVGAVHSGVALAALQVARQENKILIIPNAGLDAATRQLCAPNIFRTSFSNWQPGYAMGKAMANKGIKEVVTISWRYGAGQESTGGFKDAFEEAGGNVIKQIFLPFPEVEFQAQLTEIASMKPEAVYTFFAGGGAVKFVLDYAAAGLKESIPLYGAGFLTDGTLPGQGAAAEGLQTTLHYTATLDNEYNRAFQHAYQAAHGTEADVYAVQGYDAGKLLVKSLAAVNGYTSDQDALIEAMRNVSFDDSPRGPWKFSKSHNPIQNLYLREVREGANVVTGVAVEALEDPGTGCSML